MNKIVLGISLIGLAATAVSCNNKEKHIGNPEVERSFQGDWATEYLLDNENMRMRVMEKISFDTLAHSYRVQRDHKIIYPVNIDYSHLEYQGTWSADEERLFGTIDPASVKYELNPNIRDDKQFKVYQEFVNNSADVDMEKDAFIVRTIGDDRIHLIDLDLNVAHDLQRAVPEVAAGNAEAVDSVSSDSTK